MSDRTAIEWTDATANFWRGCDKVSPGCAHCYMFTAQRRYGRDPSIVVRATPGTFRAPLSRKWQQRAVEIAERESRRLRVFTCSWSDFFHEDADPWRDDAWDVIRACPQYDWQILTKRPELAADRLPADWGDGWPHVWLGVSIENRRFVARAEHLRRTPAAVRFISAEPLLGPLRCPRRRWPDGYTGPSLCLTGIDWLIVGGESGPGHRAIRPEWVRELRDCCLCQFCRLAGERAPDCALCGEHSDTKAHPRFFFKQWGGARPTSGGRKLDGRTWDEFPPRLSPSGMATAAGSLSDSLTSDAECRDHDQADAEPSITPQSSPSRAGRPRGRRSQPLAVTRPSDPSRETDAPASTRDASRETPTRRARPKQRAGLGSRVRHDLDRAGSRLRDRFARRPPRQGGGEGKWRWSDERAQGCERAIRELIADATRQSTADFERRAERVLAVAYAILDEQRAAPERSSRPPATRRAGGGGEGRGRSAGGKASRDTSRGLPVDAGAEASGAIAEAGQCPDCFGCGEPCAACVAAAGDPSPGEFKLSPGVDQVRRCACGRVYGSYHAGRAMCFLMQAPGRRQVERCVRCGQRLAVRTTSECTAELQDAAAGGAGEGGGGGDGSSAVGRASGDTSLTPGERVCQRAGCGRPIPAGSRPEARYCSKRCRQAVSRSRVRARGTVERSERRERCAWCEGPMPDGRRGEAAFCSKRCRQASSRFGLAVTRGHRPSASVAAASTSDTSLAAAGERDTSPAAGAELGATGRAAEASGKVVFSTLAAAWPLEVRAGTVELVDGLIAAEQACFGAWCALLDRRGQVDPEAVIASQQPVREAAWRLRSWCADPHLRKLAEVERLELLRAHAREEQAAQAAIEARRRKGEREEIRQAWNERRAWLYGARDALSIALGWPHRGELVTVTGSYHDHQPGPGSRRASYEGPGIYLHGYDNHNVSHQVWIPELDRKGRRCELIVGWQPRLERWGCADPGGDIALRRNCAPDAPLPVPLPRWPTPDDVAAFSAPGDRADVPAQAEPRGLRDTSSSLAGVADAGGATGATRRCDGGSSGPRATRRRPPRRRVLDDASRAMRFAFADPPYPGKAGYYPEREEVDHEQLIARLTREFPDGWALATSTAALQHVLGLCPDGVRVCSWHRSVRRTASRRPLTGWEPLIVHGGRGLPTGATQTVVDALEYRGRYRAYPGAITGMKPPQYAVWAFQQLGARAGDELVDLYPGSGAVSEAWRRYTAASTDDTSRAGARADDDTSRTPAIEVLSDVSPGPTTVVPPPGHRAERATTLTLFDAGTTGDPSSEASESAA